MELGHTIDSGLGQESGGLGTSGAVIRNGLPFRGNGRPIRDLGLADALLARMRVGRAIAVDWLPDVSWEVTIRRSRP